MLYVLRCRRLQAACLAADLLIDAAPNGAKQAAELANVAVSANGSVEDGVERGVDAAACAASAADVAHLPPRIKVLSSTLLFLAWYVGGPLLELNPC